MVAGTGAAKLLWELEKRNMPILVIQGYSVLEEDQGRLVELTKMLRIEAQYSPGFQSGILWQELTSAAQFLWITAWHTYEEFESFQARPNVRQVSADVHAILIQPSDLRCFALAMGVG